MNLSPEISDLLEELAGPQKGLEEGRRFSISTIFDNVPDEGERNTLLENPDDSKRVSIELIIVRATGSININLFKDITNAQGEQGRSFVTNMLIGDDSAPNTDISTPSSFDGEKIDEILIPSSGAFGLGETTAEIALLQVRPNTSVAVQYVNVSGITIDMDMSIVFREDER